MIVSGLLSAHRAPAQLLDLILAGQLVLLIDDRIMAEYREVAHHPRFGLAATEADRVLDALAAMADHVTAPPLAVTLPDPDDLPCLEVAMTGRADALVTGNTRHFAPVVGRHQVPLRTPRDMLASLRAADLDR